jgi:hypothetical protein
VVEGSSPGGWYRHNGVGYFARIRNTRCTPDFSHVMRGIYLFRRNPTLDSIIIQYTTCHLVGENGFYCKTQDLQLAYLLVLLFPLLQLSELRLPGIHHSHNARPTGFPRVHAFDERGRQTISKWKCARRHHCRSVLCMVFTKTSIFLISLTDILHRPEDVLGSSLGAGATTGSAVSPR